MSTYNLTDRQKKIIRRIVEEVKNGNLQENFQVTGFYDPGRYYYTDASSGMKRVILEENQNPNIDFSWGTFDALCNAELIIYSSDENSSSDTRSFVLTGEAYKAVESDFNQPDTSFIRYITPLADVSNLDNELKTRCLPILGAGSSDPTLWDSAVRTAGVILEERLRQKGNISDPNVTGQGLVNKVFSKTGTLASKFKVDSERQGYRDLYAGTIGTYRNPSAHRLIDPTPEEGGTFIMFVDLLLKKLDNL
ncbi:MAG: TIGR02391 family protein [Cyanobacteria bacterium P01_A01_bin.40]